MELSKQSVHDFWNTASCGEPLYLHGDDRAAYEAQAAKRYQLEPYIGGFAGFDSTRGARVLEIGVGLGADHQRFAEAGALLTGIDLTERAIEHTKHRFALFGLASELRTADAENLPFESESFDVVYSWGVLHHSPNTSTAIGEVYRVLRPGGRASVMIYQKYSLVGFMLWVRYAMLRGRPTTSLAEVYQNHLESPGTKAYTMTEAQQLFARFSRVETETILTHGDLLESEAGQRHRGPMLTIARAIWPRRFLRAFGSRFGLFLLIHATK